MFFYYIMPLYVMDVLFLFVSHILNNLFKQNPSKPQKMSLVEVRQNSVGRQKDIFYSIFKKLSTELYTMQVAYSLANDLLFCFSFLCVVFQATFATRLLAQIRTKWSKKRSEKLIIFTATFLFIYKLIFDLKSVNSLVGANKLSHQCCIKYLISFNIGKQLSQ